MIHSRWLLAVAILLALTGCSGHPPNTAVPENKAAQSDGSLREATPLTAIIKTRGVRPLEPNSPVAILDQAQKELEKTDPHHRYRGVTYNLTATNALDSDWIIQTPNRWGRRGGDLIYYPLSACAGCVPDIALPACKTNADCGGGMCAPLAAAAQLRHDYWDPLWQWSKRAAISGSDATRCVFRESLKL